MHVHTFEQFLNFFSFTNSIDIPENFEISGSHLY